MPVLTRIEAALIQTIRAAAPVAALAAGACASTATGPGGPGPERVRGAVPIVHGTSGDRIAWPDLLEAAASADVVILGEHHDDAVGHRVQLALVEDLLRQRPSSAVSMEMLDRSEQSVVDDYLAGLIDLETFYERTASTRWRKIALEYLDRSIGRREFERRITRIGWPDWERNYQPIIDAAKDAGAPVIAANTPWLVYTSVARKEGFEALARATPAQRALFDLPGELPDGAYRRRFWEVVAGRAEGESPPEVAVDEQDAHGEGLTDEQVLGMFRAQSMMDATMAASIAAALDAGAGHVVHLVGAFHCDFEGGLVQALRRRSPGAEILVISLVPEAAGHLRDDDVGRADHVVYTGP